MLKLAAQAKHLTGSVNLCMAGGVALNCVANGVISSSSLFDRMWIQPAASDAGGALGAALIGAHVYFDSPRPSRIDASDSQRGSFLGPEYSHAEITAALDAAGVRYRQLQPDERHRLAAEVIADGAIVGYFFGRMEFGPRALGARSIFADPRNPGTQAALNLKIKFRESWRPFAAAVLAEDAHEYFKMREENPYMLLVCDLLERHRKPVEELDSENLMERLGQVRSNVPAITHVDYSTRVQTVRSAENPDLHGLLRAFKEHTGCGMLVNTSFNVRGEPIVCTPQEAIRCFLTTEIDFLFLGDCVAVKKDVERSLIGVGGARALD